MGGVLSRTGQMGLTRVYNGRAGRARGPVERLSLPELSVVPYATRRMPEGTVAGNNSGNSRNGYGKKKKGPRGFWRPPRSGGRQKQSRGNLAFRTPQKSDKRDFSSEANRKQTESKPEANLIVRVTFRGTYITFRDHKICSAFLYAAPHLVFLTQQNRIFCCRPRPLRPQQNDLFC